jgi:hypothetical protein
MKRLLEYFRKLTLGGGKESSKRFLAIYLGFPLVTYVVVRFTTVQNMEWVLGEMFTFIVSLLGLASYENHKGIGVDKEKTTDDNQQG